MAATSDVIIIGGGVNGAAIAFYLAQRGVGVRLIERDSIGAGPTGLSCGIIRQHYSHPVTAGMALRSLRVFQNFSEMIGGQCDFHQSGFILAAGPEHIGTLETNVAMQQSVGINTRLIGVEELQEMEPSVSTEGIVGAAYEPEAGYADPHSTTASYANRAEELGAELHTGVSVASIVIEGGRATGVETSEGRFTAGAVVLAAGPWSPALSKLCGVELPITPCRVQVCLFNRAPELERKNIFIDSPLGVYARPEGEDLMLVGSVDTNEADAGIDDPDHYQRVADFDAISRYSEQLIRRFPAMTSGAFVNGYASLYDVTPDWQPILDELPGVDGLFCCAGSSGHGFKLAPAVGEMMADLVTGQEPDNDDIEMFRFARFARGELADGDYPHKILG